MQDARAETTLMGDVPSVLGSLSRAVLKGLPLIPAFMLLFGAVGYFASTQTTAKYEAKAQIIVLSKRLDDNRVTISGQERSVIIPPQTADLISESHILGSITLIEQTLSHMSGAGLTKRELVDLRGREEADTAGAVVTVATSVAPAAQSSDEFEEAVYQISENLNVMIEPGSNIISVTLMAEDPDFAVRYLKAHLEMYFLYREDLTRDNSQIEFLVERVDSLQRELADVSAERQETLSNSRAIDPAAEVELNWQTIRDEYDRIGALEVRLRELEANLRLQQSSLNAWEATGELDLPLGGGGGTSASASYNYLFDLHQAMKEASTKYTDTMEPVVQSRQQFLAAKANYLATLRQEVSAGSQNVDALKSEVADKKSTIARLRSKNEQLSQLQGELKGLDARLENTQLNYASALTNLENIQAALRTGVGLSFIRVLQEPSLTSLDPVSPNSVLFIASGAALGFLLCLLLSVVLFTRPAKTSAA